MLEDISVLVAYWLNLISILLYQAFESLSIMAHVSDFASLI